MTKKSRGLLVSAAVVTLVLIAGCQQHKHTYGEWIVTTAATCTDEGVETCTCECGDTKTRSIMATGHFYGSWITTTEATCTANGMQIRTCECGDTQTQPIKATGHSYGSWTITTAASCITDGTRTRACECGVTQTEVINAIGHKWTNTSGEKAKKCTFCLDTCFLKTESRFDKDGKLTLQYEYSYDSLSRLEAISIYAPSTENTLVGIYSNYDEHGNPQYLTWSNSLNYYRYDSNGRIIEACEYQNGKVNYIQTWTYDAVGHLAKSKFLYNLGTSSYLTTTTYEYVSDNIYYKCDESGNKKKVVCEYDVNGNKIKETDESGWTEYQWISE